MSDTSQRLDDQRMQDFITDGYIVVKADFPDEFHREVYRQIDDLFNRDGNPGNDILEKAPALYEVADHPAVAGALTSILGPDYVLHPHRHCHRNEPSSVGQKFHQDSYAVDQNIRHHHCRWAMAFYYPQDVDKTAGPTAVLPATQYYVNQDQAHEQPETPLCGPAGTVTIVQYDLWHRAMPNQSDRNRYMVKFLFCRTAEPEQPCWNHQDAAWNAPRRSDHAVPPRALCRHQWMWHLGQSEATGRPDLPVSALLETLRHGAEADRLHAAYALGSAEESIAPVLIDILRREATGSLESNMTREHTHPCQFYTSFALGAMGEKAIPFLLESLYDLDWWIRAAAADVLGDMGPVAHETTPGLLGLFQDDSPWVRRNAVEAVGTIGISSPPVIQALTNRLSDTDHRVRLNAVYALGRMGAAAEAGLRRAENDQEDYVRLYAALALERLGK